MTYHRIRSCEVKRAFETQEEAHRCTPAQQPYKCEYCGKWHLTKQNGMTAKAARLRHAKRFKDGLPIDANEWTEDDWRDLHRAMERVRKRVKERHAKEKTCE